MAAKPRQDLHCMDFDEEIPKLAESRNLLPCFLALGGTIFLILARAGFYFAFALIALTGAIAATFNLPARMISAVNLTIENALGQIASLIAFWTSATILAGEVIWLLLTSQPQSGFLRVLDLITLLTSC